VNRRVLLSARPPDADPYPKEIGTDVLDCRPKTVLAAVTTAQFDANRVERQVHVIVNDDHVIGGDSEEIRQLADGPVSLVSVERSHCVERAG
jgi:hypothetical protein